MIKPRVTCFRHKKYTDIYFDNVAFSTKRLIELLEIFSNQTLIAIIETDMDLCPWLHLPGKSARINVSITNTPITSIVMIVDAAELIQLIDYVPYCCFEGLFVANVSDNSHFEELLSSVKSTATLLVKSGMSYMSVSINVPENEMVVSIDKTQYNESHVKDKIYTIFRN